MANYKDSLVELRLKLGVSQEELAHLLGVSFSSVNRWENGRNQPTKIAKAKLKKLFDENSIYFEDTIQKMKNKEE